MNARAAWRQHVTSLVDTALGDNDAVLEAVSAAIARTVGSGGRVFAFGAGHSISLVSEMYRRAGRFRALRPVWNAALTSHEDADEETRGQLETASGYHQELTPAWAVPPTPDRWRPARGSWGANE
ncbi:MAG TPA: SIS domain-containing protein [Streptosporangiaceae bacterium]